MKNIEVSLKISLRDLMYESRLSENDIRKIEVYFQNISDLIFLLITCFCISDEDNHYTFSALDLIQSELDNKSVQTLFDEFTESAYESIERYIDESVQEMDSDFAENHINHYYNRVYGVTTALTDAFLNNFKKLYKRSFIAIHTFKIKEKKFAGNQVYYIKLHAYEIPQFDNRYIGRSRLFRYNPVFDTEEIF